jgi:tRNA modification GTPase
MPAENVAILLTPPGVAAIAVVRLAGPGVGPFLAAHFSKPTPVGRCVHGTLRDGAGNVVDDPVVVCSEDGAVADVNVHGGAWVVQAVLSQAERAGFAIRGAGDAANVAHDGTTELEREVLAHVPLARTELALRTLFAQPRAWEEARARRPRDGLGAILSDRSLHFLLHPPRVAIIGAPNVGKSTLANQLFAQERSITADVPGTTRDWVGEIANIDGLAVMLVDTPGRRETSDAIEREAIERSRAEVGRADLVVLVLDATRPPDPQESPLLQAYPNALVVLNKVDLACGRRMLVPGGIETVALHGEGVDRVRDAIRAFFGCLDAVETTPRVWTPRQREIVTRALADPFALDEITNAR